MSFSMCVWGGCEAGRFRDVTPAPRSTGPLTADGCGKEWPNSSGRKRLFPMGTEGKGKQERDGKRDRTYECKAGRSEGNGSANGFLGVGHYSWGSIRSASPEWRLAPEAVAGAEGEGCGCGVWGNESTDREVRQLELSSLISQTERVTQDH